MWRTRDGEKGRGREEGAAVITVRRTLEGKKGLKHKIKRTY
jgi:hypothetical protein